MLLLIALPVLLLVGAVQRCLHSRAPSNLLIGRARAFPPRWRICLLLVGTSATLLIAMRAVGWWIESGASGWLNLVVLVLAWDSIKVGLAAGLIGFRCLRGRALCSRRARRTVNTADGINWCSGIGSGVSRSYERSA